VFIVAVPTPVDGANEPDMSHVEEAARSLAQVLRPRDLLVLESTVSPGATRRMVSWILEERPDLRSATGDPTFFAAHCPERVIPGRVLVELVENDRVVGGICLQSTEVALRFYRSFVRGECVGTTDGVAEFVKLAENSFRDVNIAFANEISMIADQLGVDPWEVITHANRHPRVDILDPSPGEGGHCLAVDPWFLAHAAPDDSVLIRTARETNQRKTDWLIRKLLAAVRQFGAEASIVCLGLTYKPDVDDLRESAAMEVVKRLAVSTSCRVSVVEPNLPGIPEELSSFGVEWDVADQLPDNVDLLVGLVAHREFRSLADLAQRARRVFDAAGVWSRV
jgi:UDP-N-acetyl-D-mannosaminuronic acid dehydrogenase